MRPPAPALPRRVPLAARSIARWRPSWTWALGVLRSFVTSFIALAVALWLLPGTQVTQGTTSVAALAVVVLTIGALLRPLLITLTVLTGAMGLLVAGLLAQALILALALAVVPTVEPFTFTEVLLAWWAATVVAAAVNWLFDTSTEEALLGQVLGCCRTAQRHPVSGPKLLVVQLDGVSLPLLRQAITSGATPQLARWLRSGSHRVRGWNTGLPTTTPAGQAVLMHGDVSAVPGFRWYDKGLGRTFVCSSPADPAAGLEDRSCWYPGDTGLHDDLGDIEPVDLALVPIGGWGPTLSAGHLDPDEAAEAVGRVGATWSIVVHYGTFWPVGMRQLNPANHRRLFEDPPARFLAAVRARRLPTIALTPAFGDRFDLSHAGSGG